jgi:hypothetical protein
MPHLLRRLSRVAAFSIVIFGIPALASAASYFVAPNGGGSTCSQASPCQLSAGLDKAGSGDELILKDGTYKSTLFTKRAGVTIRAENTHKAIVQPPNEYDSTDNAYVRTSHNNTTVRGIVFDAERRVWPVLWIRGVENVIFENNVLKNSGPAGPLMHGGSGTRNIIFRHNLLENAQTEGMYLGASKSDPLQLNGSEWNENWQIYGNTYRNIGYDHL